MIYLAWASLCLFILGPILIHIGLLPPLGGFGMSVVGGVMGLNGVWQSKTGPEIIAHLKQHAVDALLLAPA